MFTINASYLDTIEMLQHRRKMLGEVSSKTKTIYKELDSLSKEELITLLQSVDEGDYKFCDEYFTYSRKLTEDEISKEMSDINNGIKYDISRLKKWSESSEKAYDQIVGYLDRHNIKVETLN